jgi:hypothetical protein
VDQIEDAEHLASLHVKGSPLALYNTWDAGSRTPFARAASRRLPLAVGRRPPSRVQRGEIHMSEAWSIVMLIGGALFVAGVVPIARERAPARRAADHATFRVEFAHTLRRVDRLQPARQWAVAKMRNQQRTQNGHIRNNTRDASRRIIETSVTPICRRNCVASDRACTRVTPGNLHGKEGSAVRVRQRARNTCKSASSVA